MTTATAAPEQLIKRLLAGAGELPVLPEVAARILDEIRSPNLDAPRVAELVAKDPVLTTAVLRAANSALYGGAIEVTDLRFAMVRVGLQEVRHLVLTLVLHSRVADPQVYGAAGAHLMDHSLAAAFASRLVADASVAPAEQSFLCGLLHDFGRLALIKALRQGLGLTREELPPAMRALVEEHHQEAGALLATEWRLPETVILAARYHHEPERAPDHRPLVAVVSYADALVRHLGLGGPAHPEIDLARHPAVELLNLTPRATEDLLGTLPGLFATARAAVTGGASRTGAPGPRASQG